MIKVEANGDVSIDVSGNEYSLANNLSYKEFLILLTSPNPEVVFSDSEFDPDPLITDPDLCAIAQRYSEFFKEFAAMRGAFLLENATSVAAGMQAINDAVAALTEDDADVVSAEPTAGDERVVVEETSDNCALQID